MSEEKAVTTQTAHDDGLSVFSNAQTFATAQRIALMLSQSQLVPATYQGQAGLPNCMIALEMAQRIGASPLMVMQNLYIVHGRPAWSSQFLISCVNASRRFSPIRYRMVGEHGTDDWGCVAWAVDREGVTLESPCVTIGIAKAEGWYSKNGSKWKTMPDLMLRYRAATLFARLYAPEITMGIRTDDEVIDVAPVVTEMQRIEPEAVSPSPVAEPGILARKRKPAAEAPADDMPFTATDGGAE